MSQNDVGLANNAYKLNTLYFYLTEGCNLRCRHCWLAPKHEQGDLKHPYLDLGLFRSIIEQAKPLGLTGVKLTGGEPLMHPHITEIIEYVKKEGLGLTVETNGVLCTPELAFKLAEGEKALVSVSLDGADAPTHEWVRGVKGCFEAALAGIKNLISAGIPTQVIMSVMRRNREQMETLVRWCESLGVDSVKFNIVNPIARGEAVHRSGETLSIAELVSTGEWVERELIPTSKIRIYYDHPAAFRPLSRMFSGEDRGGCSACGVFGILGVLGDGSYALCGIGTTVPELVFGHAAKDRLDEVWNHHPLLKEMREGLPRRLGGLCRRCVMKAFCLGCCIAQNYYTHKSLWTPFWYCDQAYQAGLFPQTRLRPEA